MLEYYHKLQPMPKSVSEFKYALRLLCSVLSEKKQLTTLRKTAPSDYRHVCQPAVDILNV